MGPVRASTSIDTVLKKIYYNPASTGGFGGIKRLHAAAAKRLPKLSLSQVKNWLSTQDVYTLHRDARVRFPREKTFAERENQQWQCDLIDMTPTVARQNRGHRYILICIDIFSKKAHVVPIKNKSGLVLANAFLQIFNEIPTTPSKIQVDEGTEFFNSNVKSLFKKRNIQLFHTFSETKASTVERLIRTVKSKLWKVFTHRNNKKFLDVLQPIVTAYNRTKHNTIGISPNEVDVYTRKKVRERLYGDKTPIWSASVKKASKAGVESKLLKSITAHLKKKTKHVVFKKGDKVRISKYRAVFRKAYQGNWTMEVFTVHNVYSKSKSKPMQYGLKDVDGEDIEGRFYSFELQKVVIPDWEHYTIDCLRERKGKGRSLQYLVRFKGFPADYDRFVRASHIRGKKLPWCVKI